MKIAVQLYTLRDLLSADTWRTLKRLSEMGFRTGELAGTYGKPEQEFADKCKEFGIQIISPHLGIDEFEKNPDHVASLCKIMGTDKAVLPWIGKDVYGEGWAKAGARMNKIGRAMKDRGVEFLYHNHAFEFEKENGVPGFDILWDNADPELVGCEMDVFWVVTGGGDPVEYLKKLKGRVRTMHYKDMEKGEKRGFADVGHGILPWKEIIAASLDVGVEYAIIERDENVGDPLEHVAKSRDFLRSQGLKD